MSENTTLFEPEFSESVNAIQDLKLQGFFYKQGFQRIIEYMLTKIPTVMLRMHIFQLQKSVGKNDTFLGARFSYYLEII